jgi:hypothetical protein
MRLTTEKAKSSGKKGSRSRGVLCIEGEFVTLHEICEREKISEDALGKRLAKLRKQEGPITWDKIRGAG